MWELPVGGGAADAEVMSDLGGGQECEIVVGHVVWPAEPFCEGGA